jgi:hypothetical protein
MPKTPIKQPEDRNTLAAALKSFKRIGIVAIERIANRHANNICTKDKDSRHLGLYTLKRGTIL